MAREIKPFSQYLKERAELEVTPEAALKGYTSGQIISRLSELMGVLSDSVRFGVPSDTLGRATTYRDINGAIQKIKDMEHYYASKGEDVRFYCWSISYNGSWKTTQGLRKKIDAAGGFGEEINMSLKKVLDYFTQNPEDSDNVRSLSISMDAKSIRAAMKSSTGEKEEAPKTEPNENEPTSGEATA